eukprot:scaffold12806_cov55-Attheya_sp.AAC.1
MMHNFKSVKIIGCTYNGTDSHVKHSRLFTSGPQPPDEFEIECGDVINAWGEYSHYYCSC